MVYGDEEATEAKISTSDPLAHATSDASLTATRLDDTPFVSTEPPVRVEDVSPTPPRSGNVELKREETRTWLAVVLMLYLGISIVGVSWYIVSDRFDRVQFDALLKSKETQELLNDEKFKEFIQEERKEQRSLHLELITLLWTSQVTLVGSALGFYFGQISSKGKSDD